jgi:hypothetical protein
MQNQMAKHMGFNLKSPPPMLPDTDKLLDQAECTAAAHALLDRCDALVCGELSWKDFQAELFEVEDEALISQGAYGEVRTALRCCRAASVRARAPRVAHLSPCCACVALH